MKNYFRILFISLLIVMNGINYTDAQQVDVQYLNPSINATGLYKYLRFGTSSDYYAGFMLNQTAGDYGNGNDFSLFTYNNRDLTIRTGTGNFVVFPSSGGKMGIGTTNPNETLEIGGSGRMFIGNNGGSARKGILFQGLSGTYARIVAHDYGSSQGIDLILNDSGGKVGIGTTSPSAVLDVEKNFNGTSTIEISNSNTGNLARRGISIGNGTAGNSVFLLSTSANYNAVNTWANAGVLGTDSQLSNGLILRSSTGKIRFQPSGTTDKIVFDANGKVGIGTTTPTSSLQVMGDIAIQYGKSLKVDTDWNGAGGATILKTGWESSRGDFVDFYVAGNGEENKTVKMSIDQNGKVGIGTTIVPTDYKLAVAGKIIAEGVKVQVQTSWPDYVFSKNYDLKSLKETESYIKEEGHLPNIPSAQEVFENGIELGEMNAKLLEKIEELTLHLISQQKRIEELERKVGE